MLQQVSVIDPGSLAAWASVVLAGLGLGGGAFGFVQRRKVRALEEANLKLEQRKAELEIRQAEEAALTRDAEQARHLRVEIRQKDGKYVAQVRNDSNSVITELMAYVFGAGEGDSFGTSWAVLRPGETYDAYYFGDTPPTGADVRFKDAANRYWRLNELGVLARNTEPYSRVIPRIRGGKQPSPDQIAQQIRLQDDPRAR